VDVTASVGLRITAQEMPTLADCIAAELARHDTPQLRLAAGLSSYLAADFSASARHLEAAYVGYRAEHNARRAALAATHLGRLYYDGTGNAAVANGWFARAQRLLEPEGDCVERGWAALALVGCSVADADELDRNAELALRIARAFDDIDLECKALADSGLALVSQGRVDEGMRRIDEAMAMVSAECDNIFISGQVRCCLVSACERTGDLPRLEAWLVNAAVVEPAYFGPAARPNLLLAHCQREYGSLLCQAGRWGEAEATLRHAVDITDALHFHQRADSRAALAALRVDQGRLPEAAALLNGMEQRAEVQLPLIRLHHARGDHDLAVAVARHALRTFSGDRLRTTPIYRVLVDAELARGNCAGAKYAADALRAAAEQAPQPPIRAIAEWAAARIARTEGDAPGAVRHLEAGLHVLPGNEWPLLAADLHLELADVLATVDRAVAVAEARRALAIYGRVGAVRMHDAQRLLHQLGGSVDATAAVPDAVRRLTPREQEILQLLALGMSNPAIAERLVISPKTAEHHVSAILRKLQLASRSEAAVYAATLPTQRSGAVSP
jgi:DNA-binding CsgD family transcriptional regulator